MFNVEEPTGYVDTAADKKNVKIDATLLCSTRLSEAQLAHTDYKAEIVGKAVIGLLPLGPFGAALQLWTKPLEVEEQGTLISISRNTLALFPSNCVHGGGFKIAGDTDVKKEKSNFRIHFYIQQGVKNEDDVRKNTYHLPGNTTQLSTLKTDSPCIGPLDKHVFKWGHDYGQP